MKKLRKNTFEHIQGKELSVEPDGITPENPGKY